MIDVPGQITYWIQGAEDSFEVASILIRNRKTLEALFFAHLAIEKGLKAHVVKKTKAVPQRSHNLIRLAELTGISLDDDLTDFLGQLMAYQLEGRYPSDRLSKPSDELARQLLVQCKRTLAWLKSQL